MVRKEDRKEGWSRSAHGQGRCGKVTIILCASSRQGPPELPPPPSTPASPLTLRLDLLKAWPLDQQQCIIQERVRNVSSWLHPSPITSEALGVQPRDLHSDKPSRGLNVGSSVSPTVLDHTFTSITTQAMPELQGWVPGAPEARAFPQYSGALRPGPKWGHCLPPSVCPHLRGTSLLWL